MIKSYKSELMDYYENIRKTEKDNLHKRKKEIEENHPEIIKMDNEIGRLSVKLSLTVMKNSPDKDKEILKIKDRIESLREQKYETLVANGYNMFYLNLNYKCDKCKDTGYVGINKCTCYNKNLINIYYKKSNIEKLLQSNNFNNFDLDKFRKVAIEGEPMSPYENMQRNYDRIQNSYLNNFHNNNMNLLFFGNSGTGKSFFSHCIAKYLMDNGFLVVYRTADELLKTLNELRFSKDKSSTLKDLEALLYDCDLLIIDDLGTELISDYNVTEFFTFLNKKLLNNKKMLISTNFSLNRIKENYDERISSRLLGNFTPIKFFGDDIRVESKRKKRTH
ncbi:ATP-binding protein [Clostridium massiliamazoniense]|uniref:ATP-binding protein n=1 Tax=Clostridium massiliamazoniense TaxID=1347366 RepID=UPI0006D82564|nr:ATP-binding protein [Clostridium massiliamazoniense]